MFISAPCANCAIKVRSWPGFGRLLIDFESRVVVVFGFSRLSSPCRASTVTVCELEETCKEKLNEIVRPTGTIVGCDFCAANPSA